MKPPKTREQASADNARKWNARQREQVPLFIQAGLEQQLVEQGVIQDRAEDHQLRITQSQHDRLAALDRRCEVRGRQYRLAAMSYLPDQFEELEERLTSMQERFPSMQGPVNICDYWYTALHKHLDRAALIVLLDTLYPEHAQTLRFTDQVNARIQASQEKGIYNPWPVCKASPA